ncbi:hypothetical protein AAC387_Pa03g2578 [Persea americana]
MLTLLPSQRTLALCRSSLGSALRTSLACAAIACVKLYGPAPLRRQIDYPALSYVTALLLVSGTTLGEVVRGAAHVAYGTVQGVVPAIVCLWAVGPARFSITTTAVAVAASALVVALPESTPVLSKRVAMAQVVVVYVFACVRGVSTDAVMDPVHVAVSTGVGALASVVALLLPFPYPRMGYYEVKENRKQFAEIVSDRLKLYVNAFCAENITSAMASVSQAKSLENTGKNLLISIELKQDSIPWERPSMILAAANLRRSSEILGNMEVPLKGMEMALFSCPSFPAKIVNEELKDLLHSITEDTRQTLTQMGCPEHSNCSTAPKTEEQVPHKSLQVAFPTQQDIPSLFFLFCIKLLHNQSITAQPTCANLENNAISMKEPANLHNQKPGPMKKILAGWSMGINRDRLILAFKCSLALGLSVLFGLLFSKKNGYWAGVTVALGMAPWREPTFKAANTKAQGTALGSVYGVLGCLISQNFMEFRFLVLIPWIVFTSFLRHSRMYGPAGGVSATIAAVLLLGRKDYGLPSDFAIARMTESFIGLCCSIFVELLLQPTRASSLARILLSESLGALHECIKSMALDVYISKSTTCLVALKNKEKKLRKHIHELAKHIEEADVEPNFWFMPLPTASCRRILASLSKMVELLLFAVHGMEFLGHESHALGVVWNDLQEHLNGDLMLFKEACSSIKCLEEITRIKSLARLEMEFQRKNKNSTNDLELGKSPDAAEFRVLSADEEMEKIVGSFLQHVKEDISRTHLGEGKERKSNVVLCLSAIGFCMEGLMKEIGEIEKGVKELLQWENPSSCINLHEISCKMDDLST